MTGPQSHAEDAALVALIDGEADPAERRRLEALIAGDPVVAARFDTLSRTSVDFAAAFAPLLAEAPVTRLQARLDAVSGSGMAPSAGGVSAASGAASHPAGGRHWKRRELLAAGFALFVAGSLAPQFVGGAVPFREPDEDHGDDWRAAVAAYLELYTAETLANLPGDEVALNHQLGDVGVALGLGLSTGAVALAGLRLRRAQTFRYDAAPLAQIAYLDADEAPAALCIIARAGVLAVVETEQRRGMNVAYWSTPAHQFMLIGHRPMAEIEGLAASLAPRLDA